MSEPILINGVDFSEVLSGAEVARLFAVNPKTVVRWANEGRLSTTRTLGNHRRFSRVEVEGLLRYVYKRRGEA